MLRNANFSIYCTSTLTRFSHFQTRASVEHLLAMAASSSTSSTRKRLTSHEISLITEAASKPGPNGTFQCSLCNKQFGYKNGLIRHIRLTHVGRVQLCSPACLLLLVSNSQCTREYFCCCLKVRSRTSATSACVVSATNTSSSST